MKLDIVDNLQLTSAFDEAWGMNLIDKLSDICDNITESEERKMRSRTDETLRYVQFLARRFDKNDVNAVVLIILLELGLSPSRDGFYYLRNAITVDSSHPEKFVAKGLYLSIGEMYYIFSSDKQVEQAIRSAIQAAWEERDEEIWNLFFPPSEGGKTKRPSNKEFITRISCIVELWQSCKEASYERI